MTKPGFRRSLACLLGDTRHLVLPLVFLGFVAVALDSLLVPVVRAQEHEIGPEEASKDGGGRVVETGDPLGLGGIERPAIPEHVRPEIRRLIGRLVSEKPAERKAAERVLRKMGVAAVPDLRAWLGRVRLESERVEIFLRSLLSEIVGGELPATAVSRDFSAAEFFERKLRQAQEHLKYGRYDRAKRIAVSILELDANTPLKFLCRRLIRKAAEKKVSEKLEARVDVGSLVYEVGEKPEIVFRLQNRSDATARFEVRENVFGEVTITVERRFLNGNKSHSTRMALRLPQRYALVSLPPGHGWEFDIPFKTPKDLPIQNVAARIKFHAVFRPTLWEIEGEPDGNIPLRTVETEIWLIPPGKKRKFEDPLKRLTLARLLDRPEDFLIAGWFCAWAGERDRDLNARLIDRIALEFDQLDPKYHLLAHELLRHATGRIFKKPEDWMRWWRREKAARERENPGASTGDPASDRVPSDQRTRPFTDRD